jgi:hypothetical protein
MKSTRLAKALLSALLGIAASHGLAATLYSDRATFTTVLGAHTTDDYERAGYQAGDKTNLPAFDIFSDTGMSAVFGQTRYKSTTFANRNYLQNFAVDTYYCAGCNGSFILDFTSTSYGSASGVYGVGFDYASQGATLFITYGDGSTEDIALADKGYTPTTFFGLTDTRLLKSIAFGLSGGGAFSGAAGSAGIDDLTIGSAAAVPAPATLALSFLSLAALVAFKRRQ